MCTSLNAQVYRYSMYVQVETRNERPSARPGKLGCRDFTWESDEGVSVHGWSTCGGAGAHGRAATEAAAPAAAAADGALRSGDLRVVSTTGELERAAPGEDSRGDGGGGGILPGLSVPDEGAAKDSGGFASAAEPSADAPLTLRVRALSESARRNGGETALAGTTAEEAAPEAPRAAGCGEWLPSLSMPRTSTSSCGRNKAPTFCTEGASDE